MNSLKYTVTLLMFPILVFCQAPQKKVLFVHGFESSSQSWIQKQTPDDFLSPPDEPNNPIVDACYYLDYNLNTGFTSIINDLVDVIDDNNNPGDEWVIVGHSLGGLLSRMALPCLAAYNIKSVVTIGTPFQGAPAATVDENDAQQIVDTYRDMMTAGLNFGVHPLVWFVAGMTNWESFQQALEIPEFIQHGKNKADYYIGRAQEFSAADLLGPNGTIIQQVNNAPPTDIPHRSIIGSERSPTIIRWLSEFDDLIPPGSDELDLLDYGANIQNWYSINLNAWDYQAEFFGNLCWWNLGGCGLASEGRHGRREWYKGFIAWNNIDLSWSDAIGGNSDVMLREEIVHHPGGWTCADIFSGEYMGGAIFREIRNGTHDFTVDLYDPGQGGNENCFYVDPWDETIRYWVHTGTKNDGLIQPKMERWEENDIWEPANPDQMHPDNNYYYRDVDQDGGWNHSEMMRYTRIYDGEDTGTPAAEVDTPLEINAGFIRTQFTIN